jgi:hypothetical protein
MKEHIARGLLLHPQELLRVLQVIIVLQAKVNPGLLRPVTFPSEREQ